MNEKLTVRELTQMIEDGLNGLDGANYDYVIHTQVGRQDELPKELKGHLNQDNKVVGVARTMSGGYSKLPYQEYYRINLRVNLFIRNDQYQNVNEEIIKYVTEKNGVAVQQGDFNYIPNFELGRPGSSQVIQGVDRTPLYFNVDFVVAQKGLLSEDVEIYMDGARLPLLNYETNNVASLTKKLRIKEGGDNESILKAYWMGDSLSFSFSFIYTKTTQNKELIEELYNIVDNKPIHKFRYKDWAIDKEFDVLIETINQSFEAGNFSIITMSVYPATVS